MNDILATIEGRRGELGLSQREVNKRCGFRAHLYHLIVRGKQRARVDDLKTICDVLGIGLVVDAPAAVEVAS